MKCSFPTRPPGLSDWAELANSLNQLSLHRLDSVRVKGSTQTFYALDALCRLGYLSSFRVVEKTPHGLIFRVSLRNSAGVPIASSFRAVGSGLGKHPVLINNLSNFWHSSRRLPGTELFGFFYQPGRPDSAFVGASELYGLNLHNKPGGLFSVHLELAYT
jgi:hypothetical protein